MSHNIKFMENENAFTVLSRAQELEKKGKEIINLGIGQPDFSPPNIIIENAIHSLKTRSHGYTNSKGLLELRQEISNNYLKSFSKSVDPENILISPGAKPILYIAISLLSSGGNEVIISNPSFPIYRSIINYCGSKPVFFDLKEQNNFNFIADDIIEKINDKTKLIILNTPCNPTGSVMMRSEQKKLFNFLKNFKNKIYVLSDEIYSKIIFHSNETSLIEQSGLLDNLIVVNGLSKSHSMTGWRIGWGIFPNELIDDAVKYATNIYSCVNNFTQYAAISALRETDEYVENLKKSFEERTILMVKGINLINGFSCIFPKGSFYCYPNIKKTGLTSKELQHELLEKLGIATIDGNNFGLKNDCFIRISCCTSKNNINKALTILKNHFNK